MPVEKTERKDSIERTMYSTPREYTPPPPKKEEKCGQSTVEMSGEVLLNGVRHSGSVSHICKKPKNHEGKCMCECGYFWPTWLAPREG